MRRTLAVLMIVTFALSSCSQTTQESSTSRPSGPTGPQTLDGAGPEWTDVKSLAQSADAIFLGTVGQLHSQLVDHGGDESNPGIPMSIYEFQVTSTLRGAPPTSPVYLAWLDTDLVQTAEETSHLVPGQEMLVFAEQVTSSDAPGLGAAEGIDDVFVPLSFDNGVLDVTGGLAVPRRALVRLKPGAASARAFPVPAVVQVVAEAGAPAD